MMPTAPRPRSALLLLLGILAPLGRGWGQEITTAHDSAVHVLNRLAFGPRPGDVAAVARSGVGRWIDDQLHPDRLPDTGLRRMESAFGIIDLSREDWTGAYLDLVRQRRAAQRKATPDSGRAGERTPRQMTGSGSEFRRWSEEVPALALMRAAVSERQLYEVMVDFWTNHFNVFIGKGLDRALLPSYIEGTIRPHAMGNFAELLRATAHDPAMLFYLDQVQSVAPGATPPGMDRLRRAQARGGPGSRADSAMRAMEGRLPTGLNENYARELLELHTVGVDGGYTQEDVVNVARILSGWSLARPDGRGRRDDGRIAFVFNEWAHDRGAKVVLGERFPAGRGQDEGERLLGLLARHPATMHHVSAKLCARFVADIPPDDCIDRAVAAWRKSDGSIPTILGAICAAPDFWAAATQGSKVKTPLEFTISAVRAVGAMPDRTPGMARVVGRLGQPLYQQPTPTGYPETDAEWVNSGALLARMNVAMSLAAGKLPGIDVDLDRIVPVTADSEALVRQADQAILAGRMSDHSRGVILRHLADVPDPASRRTLVVALTLGGPEFQRQ